MIRNSKKRERSWTSGSPEKRWNSEINYATPINKQTRSKELQALKLSTNNRGSPFCFQFKVLKVVRSFKRRERNTSEKTKDRDSKFRFFFFSYFWSVLFSEDRPFRFASFFACFLNNWNKRKTDIHVEGGIGEGCECTVQYFSF